MQTAFPSNSGNVLDTSLSSQGVEDFISQEALFLTVSIVEASSRVDQFSAYVTLFKEHLKQLGRLSAAEDRKALCYFYLGELFAKCGKTYNLWRQRDARFKDVVISAEVRMKYALIYYINAMIETDKESQCLERYSRLQTTKWWHQRQDLKRVNNNKERILLRIILHLTDFLQRDPIMSSALDTLFPKAQTILCSHINRAYKLFLSFWREDPYVLRMLCKYPETIFDKVGINVAKKRRQALKKNKEIEGGKTS